MILVDTDVMIDIFRNSLLILDKNKTPVNNEGLLSLTTYS
jgi:hypothetical protein